MTKNAHDISFQSKVGTIYFRDNLYLEYVPHEGKKEHQVEEMIKEYEWMMNILQGKRVPFLSNNQSLMKMEGNELEFFKKTITDFACAFISLSNDGISKFIMHAILIFYKPDIPFLITTDYKKAHEFINKHIDDK